MKKAIFLLPLATLAMAGTTGSVRAHTNFLYENAFKNKQNGQQRQAVQNGQKARVNEISLAEALIDAEIKVKGTGLSAGVKVTKEKVEFPINDTITNTPSRANAYIKYDLPEMNKG